MHSPLITANFARDEDKVIGVVDIVHQTEAMEETDWISHIAGAPWAYKEAGIIRFEEDIETHQLRMYHWLST